MTVDHCMKNNGGCQDTCTSSKTGPVCGCNAGYKLDASKKNCTGNLVLSDKVRINQTDET